MKRFIGVILILSLLLSACNKDSKNESSQEDKTEDSPTTNQQDENKSETKETNVNEVELKEFASSLYEANKRSEIEHFDDLTTDNVKSVINRQFHGANTENSKNYEKSVSNARIFQQLDDSNRYLVTLEVKYTNHKKKNITWLQKTVDLKIKGGKVDEFQEIGSREIFNEQD